MKQIGHSFPTVTLNSRPIVKRKIIVFFIKCPKAQHQFEKFANIFAIVIQIGGVIAYLKVSN